jgi:Phosphotransferase enzyme family
LQAQDPRNFTEVVGWERSQRDKYREVARILARIARILRRILGAVGWRGNRVRWRTAGAYARAMYSDWIAQVTPYPLTGPIEVIKDRPWSLVAKVRTAGGLLWFKENRAGSHFEAGLLDALARWVPDAVLTPLATDPARGWSLQPDGGAVLRDADPRPDAQAWADLLADHAGLQRRLAAHVPEMLALGVPDQRPHTLMAQLDRLPPNDHVDALRPRLAADCAALTTSAIPPTLQHDDLHDGNVFGSGRCFDWGDANIAHPFSVLLIALRVAADEFDDATALTRIRDAYLDAWSDLADRPTLLREAALAIELGKIGRALAWDRSLATPADRAEYGANVTAWLDRLGETD